MTQEVTLIAEDFDSNTYTSPYDCPIAKMLKRLELMQSPSVSGSDKHRIREEGANNYSYSYNPLEWNFDIYVDQNILMKKNPEHTYTITLTKID